MKLQLLLLFGIAIITSQLSAQEKVNRCYTHELIEQNNKLHSGYAEAVNSAFEYAKANAKKHKVQGEDSILRVPVVVHIVYRDQTENIDDSLVYNQIDVLNEDYRRMNADTSLTRQEFMPFAGDAGIEFYLAEVDPDGNPTTGIIKKSSTAASFITFDFQNFTYSMDVVKYDSAGGSNAWPVDQYLNIWVCDLSMPIIGDALLGFAYPPVGAPNWPAGSTPVDANADGVVIHYKVMGRNNPNAIGALAGASRGRTVTHEVGHYLGLRHIWGDGDCTLDDGISDTPDADSDAGFICDYSKNTCAETSIEYPDMIENYMDYAADDCQNLFTHEQINLIRSSLMNLRSGLLIEQVAGIKNNEYANNIDFDLYPSPASQFVNIRISNTYYAKNIQIELLDILGHKINSYPITNKNNLVQFPLENVLAGIYYVRLINTNGNQSSIQKPLVVIH